MLVAFLIMSGNVIATYQYAHVKCAKELNNHIAAGDTVALDGVSDHKYSFYSYLDVKDITVVIYNESVNADLIVSNKNISYANYEKIGEFKTTISYTQIQKLWNMIRGRSVSDAEVGDIIHLWRRI
jgi:hypothetical protein